MAFSLEKRWQKGRKWRFLALFFFGVLLYLPTVGFEYTLDDAIVIYDNQFTQEGIRGIPDLFKYDTFRGFFKKEGKEGLVAGGRYRPLTLATFAIEYQLVGNNPWLSHLMNVLLYGLLAVVICFFLEQHLFQQRSDDALAFIIALLFVAHPIHSEVVANIKGRDEIMSMLLGLASLHLLFKGRNIGSAALIILALLAKEMALTWIAIAGLYYLIMAKTSWLDMIKKVLPLLSGTLVYLIIRISVLGWPDLSGQVLEMMNNPFIKVEGNQYVAFTWFEKVASIFLSLGKYLMLIIWPHPLTHDYYPRSLGVPTLADVQVVFAVLIHLFLLVLSIIKWRKQPILSFCILFYFSSLVLISNFIFPIGTHMGERFLFMGSLGALAGVTYWLSSKLPSSYGLGLVIAIILGWSWKTIDRIPVWKNDFTLFTTDVKTSNRSAKALNAAAGSLVDQYMLAEEGARNEEDLNQALIYLEKATEIHPNYKAAYLIQGNAFYLKKAYDAAKKSYERALSLDPELTSASKNLLITLQQGAQFFGEKEGNFKKAERWLQQALKMDNNAVETLRLLGVVSGVQKNYAQALSYFQRILELEPENGMAIRNIGVTMIQMGNNEEGMKMISRVDELEKKK